MIDEQRFYPGDVIYDQDSESKMFYIVKRGKVGIQSIINTTAENLYPSKNKHQWNIVKTQRKVMYRIKELGPGEMFGHEELLEHFINVQQTGNGYLEVPKRKYRVTTIDKADIFFINI